MPTHPWCRAKGQKAPLFHAKRGPTPNHPLPEHDDFTYTLLIRETRRSTAALANSHAAPFPRRGEGWMLVISLSGCGFLLPYHLGALCSLHRVRHLVRGFVGVSGGSVAAAVAASCKEKTDFEGFMEDFSVNGKVHSDIFSLLKTILPRHLPHSTSFRPLV